MTLQKNANPTLLPLRIILLGTFVLIFARHSTAQSQSFTYTSYYSKPQTIHDVVELNGDYILVGERTLDDNISHPMYFRLDGSGNLVSDGIPFPMEVEGYISNVFTLNGDLILVVSQPFFGDETDVSSAFFGAYENFEFTTFFGSQDGFVQNCKRLDDIHYITIGQEIYTNFLHIGSIKVYNINEDWNEDYYNELFQSALPIEMYDIIKMGDGYRLFLRDYESVDANDVRMLTLSADFDILASEPLATSYQDFGSDGKFFGPVSAYALSDTTYLVYGSAPHPLATGEVNSRDGVAAVFDTSGTELSLTYTGVPDTNAYTSRHSIAARDGFFYVAGTKNFDGVHTEATSYFMLSKMDASGSVLWTKYYGNETSLKLTNVIATDDGGALMVGESQYTDNAPWYNIYVLKVDANGDLTAVDDAGKPVFSTYVFPNPSSSEIQFQLPEDQIDKVLVTIYSLTGKMVDSRLYRSGDKVNVSAYPNGVYLYELTGSDFESSGKIMIQK